MISEPIGRDRRRRHHAHFQVSELALLPGSQHVLLLEWLKKSAARTRRWDSLLLVAGPARIELAESLAQALLDCGAVILEERLSRGVWQPTALAWRDYETLCAAMGLRTRAVQDAELAASWEALRAVDWQRAELAQAWLALRTAAPDKAQARLALLAKLNDWIAQGQSGTRRNFAVFARGHSKQISTAEWSWLSEFVELADCGIQRHAPALWLAGDVQLQIAGRWLDVGAADDFMALTPRTLAQLEAGCSTATHYRLVENLTSFEKLARQQSPAEIVLWLPGYAPGWWREAVDRLLAALPLPARISCDADPDGVRIALHAAKAWNMRGLCWEAWAMGTSEAAASANKLPLSERDVRCAEELLGTPNLPPVLQELLEWCVANRCKAEQENWL